MQRSDMKFSREAARPDAETERTKSASTRLSEKERKGNALASGAEEGRDKLR